MHWTARASKAMSSFWHPLQDRKFAVLKPDNATGNFVKVPQRIGVRIVLDPINRKPCG
jgi:multidrug resistance efflux pump